MNVGLGVEVGRGVCVLVGGGVLLGTGESVGRGVSVGTGVCVGLLDAIASAISVFATAVPISSRLIVGDGPAWLHAAVSTAMTI